jgi:hypothetical protein
MHLNTYDVFYSQCSHHLLAHIPAIFRMMILLQEWYNKPLASATLVAVNPGGKSAELDPNPNY